MTEAQTAQQKKRFLEQFAKHGNVSWAAKSARVDRRNVYRWREHDDAFLAEYRDCELRARDAVEAEIHRRGVDGVLEPVFQGGVRVGSVRKYSDVLLIFRAKKLMPEYRDKVDLNVSQVVREYHGVDVDRV